MPPTILTCGHSNRTAADFVALLQVHGITACVDVRRWPASRRQPHFAKARLAASLRQAGVSYEHEEDLGGHRVPLLQSQNLGWEEPWLRGYADHAATEPFARALGRVLHLARAEDARGGRLAVACAEREPRDCHRQVLADALLAAGADVRHVIDAGQSIPHVPPPFARFDGATVRYPARAPLQGSLFG